MVSRLTFGPLRRAPSEPRTPPLEPPGRDSFAEASVRGRRPVAARRSERKRAEARTPPHRSRRTPSANGRRRSAGGLARRIRWKWQRPQPNAAVGSKLLFGTVVLALFRHSFSPLTKRLC